MWYFASPQIIFGDEALSHLETLQGRQVFVVTDAFLATSGLLTAVQERLAKANLPCAVFAEVEPEPSLETIRRCAAAMAGHQPDWVIGLGGGSCTPWRPSACAPRPA
jgi:alcohol dehydrogenase class IV